MRWILVEFGIVLIRVLIEALVLNGIERSRKLIVL